MAVINKYESHTIDPNILSIHNVDQAGDVVSAETWVALWDLVWNLLAKYNEHFIDIYRTLGEINAELSDCIKRVEFLEGQYQGLVDRMGNLETSWSALQEAYNKVAGCYDEIKQIQNTLESGFVHYGENPPTTDFIKLWVMPTQGVPSLITSWGENDILATNYNYASAKLIKDTLNTKVNKAGDTITGPLIFNQGLADPLKDAGGKWFIGYDGGAKFKGIVGDFIRLYMDDDTDHDIVFGKSHGKHTGGASLGGHRVRNVGAPTEATDAATKEYVDTHQDLNYIPSEDVSLWECDRLYKIVRSDSTFGAAYPALFYTFADGTVTYLEGFMEAGIAYVTSHIHYVVGRDAETYYKLFFFNGKSWMCTNIYPHGKYVSKTQLVLTQFINENANHEEYPTTKAVKDYVNTYVPEAIEGYVNTFVPDYVANNHKLREIPSDDTLDWEPGVWYSTAEHIGDILWVSGFNLVDVCGIGVACMNKVDFNTHTIYTFTYIDPQQHIHAECSIDNTTHEFMGNPVINNYTFVDKMSKAIDNNNVPTVSAVKEYTAEYVSSKVEKATDAFKATASGEFLQITDVSEIEHTVTVDASGDTSRNEVATIVACGKNLCDVEHGAVFKPQNAELENVMITKVVRSDSGVSINVDSVKNSSNPHLMYLGTFPAGVYTLTLRMNEDLYTNPNSGNSDVMLTTQNSTQTLPALYNQTYFKPGDNTCLITLTETCKIAIRARVTSNTKKFTVHNLQIEFGAEATPYEFFCGGFGELDKHASSTTSFSTHISNTRVLNVFSTVPGVTLTCQYNKHSNKVLDELKKDVQDNYLKITPNTKYHTEHGCMFGWAPESYVESELKLVEGNTYSVYLGRNDGAEETVELTAMAGGVDKAFPTGTVGLVHTSNEIPELIIVDQWDGTSETPVSGVSYWYISDAVNADNFILYAEVHGLALPYIVYDTAPVECLPNNIPASKLKSGGIYNSHINDTANISHSKLDNAYNLLHYAEVADEPVYSITYDYANVLTTKGYFVVYALLMAEATTEACSPVNACIRCHVYSGNSVTQLPIPSLTADLDDCVVTGDGDDAGYNGIHMQSEIRYMAPTRNASGFWITRTNGGLRTGNTSYSNPEYVRSKTLINASNFMIGSGYDTVRKIDVYLTGANLNGLGNRELKLAKGSRVWVYYVED